MQQVRISVNLCLRLSYCGLLLNDLRLVVLHRVKIEESSTEAAIAFLDSSRIRHLGWLSLAKHVVHWLLLLVLLLHLLLLLNLLRLNWLLWGCRLEWIEGV